MRQRDSVADVDGFLILFSRGRTVQKTVHLVSEIADTCVGLLHSPHGDVSTDMEEVRREPGHVDVLVAGRLLAAKGVSVVIVRRREPRMSRVSGDAMDRGDLQITVPLRQQCVDLGGSRVRASQHDRMVHVTLGDSRVIVLGVERIVDSSEVIAAGGVEQLVAVGRRGCHACEGGGS